MGAIKRYWGNETVKERPNKNKSNCASLGMKKKKIYFHFLLDVNFVIQM